MKRLATIFALWLALVGLARAQQILPSSPVYTAPAAPPTVLYVANFSEFNILLTANAPVVFALPVVAPNSIPFRVNFCQNATGGFQPTFSTITGATIVNNVGTPNVISTANACTTQFWVFRAATNQVILQSRSPGEFGGVPFVGTIANGQTWCYQVSPGPEYIPCSGGGGGGGPGPLNVQSSPYNCKGDGSTDDTTCLQNAIYDACTVPAYTPVASTLYTAIQADYLPSPTVCYLHSQPLRIPCTDLELYGQSPSTVLCQNYSGNAIIKKSWGTGNLTYGTSLVTGPGHSLVTPNGGALPEFIDVARIVNAATTGKVVRLSSLGQFNIAFFWNPTGNAGGVFESKPAYPGSGTGAFSFTWNGSAMAISVNTTGGSHTFSACSAQTLSTVGEYEIDWDGTNYRAWFGVPGSTATQCGSNFTSSNPLVQGIYEEMLLPDGGHTQYWPDISANQDNSAPGFIDSVRIEAQTVHAAAYTTPSTKYLRDNYTVWNTNFETSLDSTQIGYTGYGSLGNAYSTVYGGSTISYTSNGNIHDLSLCANANPTGYFINVDGLWTGGGNGSHYTNLTCGDGSAQGSAAYGAMEFADNEYTTTLTNIRTFGGHATLILGSAFNHSLVTNFMADGVDGACWVEGGGGETTFTHPFCLDRGALNYNFIGAGNSAVIIDNVLDQELTNTGYLGALLNDPGVFVFDGGSFQAQNAHPFIQMDGGGTSPQFNGTDFVVGGGTPNYLINFTNGAPTTAAQFNAAVNSSAIPLTNDPQYAFWNGVSKVTLTQLNTITCPTAQIAPDGAAGWLVSNATTCVAGSLITGSGSTYCTAICNGSTGWVH